MTSPSQSLRSGSSSDPAPPLVLLCPVCRTALDAPSADLFVCERCGRSFPVIAGIPDLRLSGDRYLTLEEDRAKARRLASMEGSLTDLVRAYWQMTPEVPASLAARYAAAAAAGVQRADVHLDRLGISGCDTVLDVGCGTGGLVSAAAARGATAVGVDIALRWLVVAARGLRDAGVTATLVAADGVHLPFAPGAFSVTTCIETLEHTDDQRALVYECLASLQPGGQVYLVTANRFSLAPEPVVGLVGVGYLPRCLAAPYVRWRRATRYQYFRAVSARELRAMIGPGRQAELGAACLPPPPSGASKLRQVAQRGYELARAAPLTAQALRLVGPYHEVLCS